MEQKKRQLTEAETLLMQSHACRAEDWNTIIVSSDFQADKIYNCHFAGRVEIGTNVRISSVRGTLANYIIGDDVLIEDVGEIVCPEPSCFGNGINIVAVNEGGGREVPIYKGITAQIAYMIAMYRERKQTVEKLIQIITAKIETSRAAMGVIGSGARITGCGTIDSVNIGEGAIVKGVTLLKNGTVCSSIDNPSEIGYGVIISDFITACGVKVENGAILKRCYIGESCHIESGFSAVDSLFFANCDFANGEACSVFAGPYTVSHHKSSLLIAGLFSFFNAGSGTNQSNHLFKTGAVHQAIHGRGSKFSSNGYVMAPAKTGAFTVILGRHTSHHNSENFPFSYLVENEEKSYLIPAANLRSYGTVRDIAKWPARDKRRGEKHDLINFEEHNPYVGERLARAIEVSETLLAKDGVDVYNYERMRIKCVMLRRGLGLYRMALNATLGAILAGGCSSQQDGSGVWIDMAGMYAPKSAVAAVMDGVDSGRYTTIEQIENALIEIHAKYRDYAYNWALGMAGDADIDALIAKGEKDRSTLKEYTMADAQQDAGLAMSVGYGIDATDKQEIADDFAAVRKLN